MMYYTCQIISHVKNIGSIFYFFEAKTLYFGNIMSSHMCLFVQMEMKNGVWEGRGCEGAKLSLAIHSLWPPCLIKG